ncbi:MAG: hypothetical protein GF349_01895 [Candidatus Magasanikbacteria bacterium]|nr:hypothetical protein [Candidatus Magasanikbacteria bacterium]
MTCNSRDDCPDDSVCHYGHCVSMDINETIEDSSNNDISLQDDASPDTHTPNYNSDQNEENLSHECQKESCNDFDDNCDGIIDNVEPMPCLEENSACGEGVEECQESNLICSSQFGGSDFIGQVLNCNIEEISSTVDNPNNISSYPPIRIAYDGPESVYAFKSTHERGLELSLYSIDEELDVFIFDESCSGNFIGGGQSENYEDKWLLTIEPNTLYYIVVDGSSGRAGQFHLMAKCFSL